MNGAWFSRASVSLVCALGALYAQAAGEKVDLRDQWQKGVFVQRDQGALGTCHAFAIAPLVDFMENSRVPRGSRQNFHHVSENWLVFLSTLDRLCSATDKEVKINQGWSASANLERTLAVGYCERQHFVGYDARDNRRSLANTRALVGAHDDFAKALEGARGTMPDALKARFEQSFGVSVEDAVTLCNNAGGKAAEALRAKYAKGDLPPTTDATLAANRRSFLSCLSTAAGARERAAKFGCKAESRDWFPLDKFDDRADLRRNNIRASLKFGAPVVVSMKNYPNGKPRNDKHTWHALAVTGFDESDDTDKKLLTLNSWGEGGNDPIPYTALNNIAQATTLECPAKPAPREPAFRAALGRPADAGALTRGGPPNPLKAPGDTHL